MSTRLQSTLAVLTMILLTLPLAYSASAKDLDTTAGQLDIKDLKGVETAVSRSYAVDIGAFVEAAANDTPEPVTATGPMLMLALVMKFDNADHAADAASTMHGRLVDQLGAEPSGIEMESTKQSDLGDDAWAFTGKQDSGPRPVAVDALIVHDSEWVYMAITISENDTGSDAALALIRFSLANRVDSEDIIYDHTGLSGGGIWAKLPAEGDTVALRSSEQKVDALSGTQPIFDSQILPPSE